MTFLIPLRRWRIGMTVFTTGRSPSAAGKSGVSPGLDDVRLAEVFRPVEHLATGAILFAPGKQAAVRR